MHHSLAPSFSESTKITSSSDPWSVKSTTGFESDEPEMSGGAPGPEGLRFAGGARACKTSLSNSLLLFLCMREVRTMPPHDF